MVSSTHHFAGTRGTAEPLDKLVCFVADGPVCLDSPRAPICEKCFLSVDMRTKLRATVADSTVSPAAEIRTDRWKRQRNVQEVLGVHVDDLVGGGNLTFQKAVQWLRTGLELGTWDQSRCRFRGRESSQEYNRKSTKISMSKFAQDMEPFADPKHVKRRPSCSIGSKCTLPISWRCPQLQSQGNPLLSFATGMLQSSYSQRS